jgi:hypothetical protein
MDRNAAAEASSDEDDAARVDVGAARGVEHPSASPKSAASEGLPSLSP